MAAAQAKQPRARTHLGQLAVALLLLLSAGCGGSSPDPVAVSSLPPYTRQEAQVFDDGIAGEAFGLPEPGRALLREPDFVARAQQADFIGPIRLLTVAEDQSAEGTRYTLMVERAGPALKGKLGKRRLELPVRRGSSAQPLLRSLDTKIVGQRLLLFLRRFRRDDKMVLHFHVEADTAHVREAARSARQGKPEAASH